VPKIKYSEIENGSSQVRFKKNCLHGTRLKECLLKKNFIFYSTTFG
jgi:hypothetical protein